MEEDVFCVVVVRDENSLTQLEESLLEIYTEQML